jgi:glycosyltransferase involved in cell wall biosynthesis
LELYGRGDSEAPLRQQATELGIADRVTFHGRIPVDDVPAAVAAADIGLAPTRLDRFTALTVSGKVYEYAAMAKPIVASALPTVTRDCRDGAVAPYPSGDAAARAAAIEAVADDPAGRARSIAAASAIVGRLAWDHVAGAYLGLIDRLAGDRPGSRTEG